MSKAAEPQIESWQRDAEGQLPLKLNLGSKDVEIEGYTNVDRQLGTEVYPLEYADAIAEEIYASHILEHLPRALIPKALKDWMRVLKPGGRIRIAVPDFDWVVESYRSNSPERIQSYVVGGQLDENDVHYALFTRDVLTALMSGAGIECIRRFEAEYNDCSKLECSLNLEGTKPTTSDRELSNVGAVLAAPRFGPTMHFRCQQALSELHIPITIIEGCYWWQMLSEGMEKHLENGCEYVLTMDYDSVFGAGQVRELYRTLKAYTEYDAICALQSKRGGAKVLFAELPPELGGTGKSVFNRPVTQIMTGHFGLTMFRGDALREQPRPWMEPIPGVGGRWSGEGQIDADISFWKSWAEHGRKLGLANHVPIGHIQEMVTWPDENFEPLFQYMQDYADNGMPADVRR